MYDPNAGASHEHHQFSYPAPVASARSPQAIIDDEHLRLLRIGYFISAGQTAFVVPFGLLYAAMGFLMPTLSRGSGAPSPPAMVWIFGIFGSAIAGFAALITVAKIITAIRLKERRSRTWCLVTAGLTCLEIPYGTALGVMTFMVLGRENVRRQFESRAG